ncbi:deoxyribonuclease IV [Candidatus Parcubacteria bacterium]|nr:deoxyribonuclease IV [Candidatus Parcubacteria bacterium]
MNKIIGAHFSIANGLGNAVRTAKKQRCNTLQIFTKNPMGWQEKPLAKDEIDDFLSAKKETGIKEVISHTSYLINLASPEKQKQYLSKIALIQEFKRCAALKIKYIVMHPGAYINGSEEDGLKRIAENLNFVFEEVVDNPPSLLLETTAGQGTNLGYKFEHLAFIIKMINNKNRVGVCFDTCHSFAAGYDIRDKKSFEQTIKKFDKILGLKNLRVMHLNDSKKTLGGRIDRHQNIGNGEIGLSAFKIIMNDKRMEKIPKILETPYSKTQNDLKILLNL